MPSTKSPHLVALSTQFRDVFAGKNWHRSLVLLALTRDWPDIVGERVARHTIPAFLKQEVLWVYVNSSMWMQEMQLQKPQLIEQINESMKELWVHDIRWQLKPSWMLEEKERTTPNAVAEPDPEEEKCFSEMAVNVDNEQCREALVSLWKKFQRQRGHQD